MNRSAREQASLTERIAVGLLSAVAAFLTGACVWLLVFFMLSTTVSEYQPPFLPVAAFAAVMFLFGFATLSNLVADILGAVWQFLYRILRFWP